MGSSYLFDFAAAGFVLDPTVGTDALRGILWRGFLCELYGSTLLKVHALLFREDHRSRSEVQPL